MKVPAPSYTASLAAALLLGISRMLPAGKFVLVGLDRNNVPLFVTNAPSQQAALGLVSAMVDKLNSNDGSVVRYDVDVRPWQ